MKSRRIITLGLIIFVSLGMIINHTSQNNRKYSIMMKSNDSSSFSVLTANVGNIGIECKNANNKLCYKDVEERIARNIRELKPDVIALQEVLPPWQCQRIQEKNRKKVCHDPQTIHQVRRLVGNEYTIVCSTRMQYECIAINTSMGEFVGCDQGSLCNTARTISELSGCNNDFTISAITAKLYNGLIFDIVNFHPQSTNAKCRAKMISTVFEGTKDSPALIQEDNVILIGDFNLDPWRDSDESTIVLNSILTKGWRGKDFTYHSGIAETNPPLYTSFLFYQKKTVDHVITNFATGICQVLGESPNTSRLDGGEGTDHRAIFGTLSILP